MFLLICGLALFVALHLIPGAPGFRASLRQRFSPNGYKLGFSVLSAVSLVLVVLGLRSADFIPIYDPPVWGRTAALSLMLPALYLFASNSIRVVPSSAQVFTAHPLNWGVVVWACAHLLANGDLAHVTLFATFGLFAIVSIITGRARGATPKRTTRPAFVHELLFLAVIVIVYIALVWLHPWFTGMPLIA